MIRTGAIVVIALPLLALGCVQANLHTVHDASLLNNDVLQRRVEAALRRAGPMFKDIQVKANDGTVLLIGKVGSPNARARAEKICRGVYGVQKTINKLTLQRDVSSR